MPTIFQRMIGDLTEAEQGQRIPINAIAELFRELHRGAITAQVIIDAYSLTAAQQTDLQAINQRINAASNKQRYFEFVFSMLSLGEIAMRGDTNGALAAYIDEPTFWARINGHG